MVSKSMKSFRATLLSIGLGLFLVGSAGCGSKVVKEFEKIKEEMCACKDKECAETINKKFDEWMDKNVNAKGSKGQKNKAKKIADQYTQCMMTAMTGGPAAKDAVKPPKKDGKAEADGKK